jgi:hypothetical protein
MAATLIMIRLWRWAKAVASAGTRAIAPPSTRISQAAIIAEDSPIRSRLVAACREPTLSANVARETNPRR